MRLAVFISGRGSNFKAILDAMQRGDLPRISIEVVVSDRIDARGLEYARAAGIPCAVIDGTQHLNRTDLGEALDYALEPYQPIDMVALAGFMRILEESWVNRYLGRLINIHPSLLPELRGLHTHHRAIEAGMVQHGASVHFVTPELDAGPVIVQAQVPVLSTDTPGMLAERVLHEEHYIYPLAIRWLSEGNVRLIGQTLWWEDRPLARPILLNGLISQR